MPVLYRPQTPLKRAPNLRAQAASGASQPSAAPLGGEAGQWDQFLIGPEMAASTNWGVLLKEVRAPLKGI